jgi:hypothetical protein
MEHDGPRPDGTVLDSSLEKVRAAVAYIGIVGHLYGQVPACELNPDRLSLTELEFREARRLGLPMLIFIMGEDHPVKRSEVEQDPVKIIKLAAFRDEVTRAAEGSPLQRVYAEFNDLHEFGVAVTAAVSELRRLLDGQPADGGVYAGTAHAAGLKADELARRAQRATDQGLALALAHAAVTEYEPTPYATLTLALQVPIRCSRLRVGRTGVNLAWSGDCRLAVQVGEKDVLVLADPTDENPREIRSPVRIGNSLCWNRDHLTASSTTFSNRAIIVWRNAADLAERKKLPKRVRIPTLDMMLGFERREFSQMAWFNRDEDASVNVLAESGSYLAHSGSSLARPMVRLWLEGNSKVDTIALPVVPTEMITTGPLAWARSGELAVGGAGIIRVYHRGGKFHDLKVNGTVTALDWAADGRLAAVIGGSITIWRTWNDDKPYRLSTDARQLGALRWSARGHIAVAADELLYVWGPEQVGAEDPRPVTLPSFAPARLGWSPRSHLAALGRRGDTGEAELRIWDLGADLDTIVQNAARFPLVELTAEQRADHGLPQPPDHSS